MTNKLLSLLLLLCVTTATYAFDIIGSSKTVLCLDSTEDIAVQSAAQMVCEDFKAVSGKSLEVRSLELGVRSYANVIVAGTAGNRLSTDGLTTYLKVQTSNLKPQRSRGVGRLLVLR